MTFQDIFKSSFLENVASVSLLDMVLALALAFGIGLFILLYFRTGQICKNMHPICTGCMFWYPRRKRR